MLLLYSRRTRGALLSRNPSIGQFDKPEALEKVFAKIEYWQDKEEYSVRVWSCTYTCICTFAPVFIAKV